jgi:hypothetical protein
VYVPNLSMWALKASLSESCTLANKVSSWTLAVSKSKSSGFFSGFRNPPVGLRSEFRRLRRSLRDDFFRTEN